jgi:hypothetical protein
MEKKKLLPLSIQTFPRIRSKDYVYVDKTEHIFRLVENGGMYFLSRPRRFGKSLTVSTLRELFEGNQKLFNGLWIENKWDWSQKNPVIHLSFSILNYQGLGLARAISKELSEIAASHNIVFSEDDYKTQFKELIVGLSQKYGKVVILIDEYDKPIIDYLEKGELPQAKANQKIMKNFYSVLKDAEPHIRLLFITGVSKFAKVSIFSDLNHLTDLTLNQDFSTLVGYTQAELEANFGPHIEAIMDFQDMNRADTLAMMKDWYNGFSWDGINTLYNPFGTLTFLNERIFRNTWFSTGTPTFLVDLIKEKGVFEFEQQWMSDVSLEKYDLDNLDIKPLMFQTGYLTVKERDIKNGKILLDYPNREVRDGMYQFLLDDLTRNTHKDSSAIAVENLSQAFKDNDLDKVKLMIDTIFTDLPAPLYEPQNADKRKELQLSERFFHGTIHLVFKYLGIFIDSEVYSSLGRADSVVTTDTHIYVFEFKYNRSGKAAFEQITKKNYGDKYRMTGKTIVGIGVNFSHTHRKINGWVVKNL